MEGMLQFAKGPLFIGTFMFMILGLARLVILQVMQIREAMNRLNDRHFDVSSALRQLAEWAVPVKHVHYRPFLSVVSFLFHIGLIITPVFLFGHIALLRSAAGLGWAALPGAVADALTLLTIVCGLILMGARIFETDAAALSEPQDYLLLLLLMTPFATGFMALHPWANPLSYNAVLLIHILSGEAIFVLIPLTKLSHCVLFPFDRVSSDIFWKLPPGAGEAVARELHGNEARI